MGSIQSYALANICAMKSNINDNFYNVGTGKKTSLKELATILIELTNSDNKINYAKRSQATLVKNRIGCPKKAKKDIGFEFTIDLYQGLEKLIKWRNHNKAIKANIL